MALIRIRTIVTISTCREYYKILEFMQAIISILKHRAVSSDISAKEKEIDNDLTLLLVVLLVSWLDFMVHQPMSVS